MTSARLDADKKAKPKTRLVQRVKSGARVYPGNPASGPLYHEAEDGSRTALAPEPRGIEVPGADFEAAVNAARNRLVSKLQCLHGAVSRALEAVSDGDKVHDDVILYANAIGPLVDRYNYNIELAMYLAEEDR